MSSIAVAQPVLADRLPRSLVRDITLVVGVAAFTAVFAQIALPVPGSPVPVTGQTFAVLLSAAAVGPIRGAAGMLLYLAAGAAGMPVFADGQGGVDSAFGATGGYLVGFMVASMVVGKLAQLGLDRKVWGTVAAFAAGTAIIYLVGVTWLKFYAGYSVAEAISDGMAPFLLGDALKAVLAGALLPTAWKLLR